MTPLQIMFKNKNEEEEEEEDPNASYNKKFYGDANKYDEDYYNNYIKQYQAQTIRYYFKASTLQQFKPEFNYQLFLEPKAKLFPKPLLNIHWKGGCP